ncbi:MAG TPA: phage exclusion protein Lit family protein [Parafilimonas sp.]|nr:phage exclusion protein Lit family protein [Parafilimonas sp.]
MIIQYPVNRNFPCGPILESFDNILERAVPERKEEIEKLISSITFEITDNPKFKLWEILPFPNLITGSRKAIEVIWALSYAYWEIYQKYICGATSLGQSIFFDKDVDDSKRLLSWALENIQSEYDGIELPPNLPSPANNYEPESSAHMAIEFTQMITAFYLFHELGHIVLKGQCSEQIDEEKACDKYAIDFMLSNCPSNCFTKRALSISVGFSLLNVIGIHEKYFNGITHPFTYDRLIDNLENYVDKNDDIVWGYVIAILSLHLTNQNIAQPTKEFERFYDCIEEYKNIFKTIT